MTYGKDKRYDDAYRFFQKARSLDSNDIEVIVNMGAFYKQTGQTDMASSEYRRGMALRPDLPECYAGMAEVYVEQGQYPQAIDLLKTAVRLKPQSARAQLLLGIACARTGNQGAAEEALKKALHLAPSEAVLNSLGNLYFSEGKYEEAISHYAEAAKVGPEDPEPLYNIALAYERTGNKTAALRFYEKFLALAENNKGYQDECGLARRRILMLRRQ